jgi:hypothetical protein
MVEQAKKKSDVEMKTAADIKVRLGRRVHLGFIFLKG